MLIEDSESKARFLLVSVSLEGKHALDVLCIYVEHLKVLCSVHVMNNEYRIAPNFRGSKCS